MGALLQALADADSGSPNQLEGQQTAAYRAGFTAALQAVATAFDVSLERRPPIRLQADQRLVSGCYSRSGKQKVGCSTSSGLHCDDARQGGLAMSQNTNQQQNPQQQQSSQTVNVNMPLPAAELTSLIKALIRTLKALTALVALSDAWLVVWLALTFGVTPDAITEFLQVVVGLVGSVFK
jgi:hypothetical protein